MMNAPNMRALETSASAKAALLEEELSQGSRPPEEIERIFFHLSRYTRAAAIARLLAYADGATFRERLARSGEARRRLLQWATGARRPFNRFTATGHYGPLCDALASGADELARDIVHLSTDTLVKGHEFEEDFLYARLLGLMATGDDTAPGRVEPLLESLERIMDGQDFPRLAMCRALLAREQESFDAALQALLEERDRHFRAQASSFTPRDEEADTEPFIFVEGLSLLRLAEHRGLSVQSDYLFLPGLARPR
ncbi:Imm49 family immunity protein [Myxococcus sp. RHSTA-1-4]|uniref:Imm49 family immunity protein n=1 Tax=Myxococcus sp. RHSTA-1-4 TaxID=2874601 RepID=UPI001CBC4A95|nr:Imm49 family immunity protein [Myxococcus sp. RHSTA-1-4]MBZ4417957.1 immunity 49 family protein [Myxococcus sp. RHSTA-1-4]